jgi:hypothetical protein
MKVDDYACDICKESLRVVETMIGLQHQENCTYKQVPIEQADNHLCVPCIKELHEYFNREFPVPDEK